jgi:capsular polysaccharide transport system permease protein
MILILPQILPQRRRRYETPHDNRLAPVGRIWSLGDMKTPVSPALPSLRPPRMRTARTIFALILREMSTTYGRSPGGYVWAVLQPLGGIILLSYGFSLLVRSPSLGTSFVLFYATGYLPFEMYSSLSQKIGAALRYSKPLLAYPRVTWLDAIMARFILNTLISILVFVIMISAVMIAVETRTIIDIVPILSGMMMVALAGLGVGMMNCLLMGYFPVWERLWGIINRPLFLASGVLFLYEDMPTLVQNVLWWNPLIHAIALVRTGFYPTYEASFVSQPYVYAVSLALILLSMIFLRKGYKAALER